MDNGTSSELKTFLKSLIQDRDLPFMLDKVRERNNTLYFLSSTLPASVNPALIINVVSKWRNLQELTGKNLRVYAVCPSQKVEKYVAEMIRQDEHISITTIDIEEVGNLWI